MKDLRDFLMGVATGLFLSIAFGFGALVMADVEPQTSGWLHPSSTPVGGPPEARMAP